VIAHENANNIFGGTDMRTDVRTDITIRHEAMGALLRALGMVDTERFICMVKRDTFDYTEWRRGMWNDMTIEEIYADAAAHYEKAKG
jgi:hypothetical protein